jgi:hypothetical protein
MFPLAKEREIGFPSGVSRGTALPFVRSATITVLVLMIFGSGILAERLLMPAVPINVDPASYAVASHEILNGERLYEDIWDHKPPAPFIVYVAFEAVFGYGPSTLFVLNFLATIGIMIGLFLICRKGPGGNGAGLIAAGIWALASGSIGLEMRDPNTEVLINICLVFAFFAMFMDEERQIGVWRSIVAGMLFLAASMFKPVVVVVAAALAVGHIATSSDRSRALKEVSIMGATGIAGWLLTFAYFAATGRGALFYDSVIVYNQHYAGGLVENILAPLYGNGELFIDIIGPLAIFAAVLCIPLFFADRRRWLLAVMYVGAAWAAIALPGRFSVHYYQLWLPPFIITAAWGIGSLLRFENSILRTSGVIAGIILSIFLLITQLPDHRAVIAGDHVPVIKTLNKIEVTTAAIKSLLNDDETIIHWGNTPNIYMTARRRPPTILLFDSHLDDNPIKERLVALAKEKLDLSQTELLVVECNRPPVPEWIAEHFESVPIMEDPKGYTIYARRGGRIAGERQ